MVWAHFYCLNRMIRGVPIDPSSRHINCRETMTEATSIQPKQPILQSLSLEEKRSDQYITAIHELERRRQNWSISRLEKIATDLGVDKRLLALTWCVIRAVARTRRKPPPVRLGVNKVYSRLVGGIHKPVANGLPEKELDSVRECLLAAGWREVSARKRVEALLTGREKEIDIRESKEFVDVSDSDEEEDSDAILTLSRRGVSALPGVENVGEEKRLDIIQRVAEFARRIGEGKAPSGVSTEAVGMARHRCKAVEWVVRCGREDEGGSRGEMGMLIDDISGEAGVRLHSMTKRVLQDTFGDEGSLANGGLIALRALVPESFVRVVREREVRRLVGLMKERDMEVAEGLVKRFGSAERCLRGRVEEIGKAVIQTIHGFDKEFHSVVDGRVGNVWVVARVMKDKFGEFETARCATFLEIVGGGDEVVELTMDERLAFYEGVDESEMKRKQFSVTWEVFKALCEAGVEDCLQALRRLIAEFGEEHLLKRMVESDLSVVCCITGINSDAMTRLRHVLRDMSCSGQNIDE